MSGLLAHLYLFYLSSFQFVLLLGSWFLLLEIRADVGHQLILVFDSPEKFDSVLEVLLPSHCDRFELVAQVDRQQLQ